MSELSGIESECKGGCEEEGALAVGSQDERLRLVGGGRDGSADV